MTDARKESDYLWRDLLLQPIDEHGPNHVMVDGKKAREYITKALQERDDRITGLEGELEKHEIAFKDCPPWLKEANEKIKDLQAQLTKERELSRGLVEALKWYSSELTWKAEIEELNEEAPIMMDGGDRAKQAIRQYVGKNRV